MSNAYLSYGTQELRLRLAPTKAQLGYQLLTSEQNTLGGKVVQLLGIDITGLTITLDTGTGWEGEFKSIHSFLLEGLRYCTRTGGNMRFRYPIRQWDFKVIPQSVPALERSLDQASLEMTISFNVDEVTKALTSSIMVYELTKLKDSMLETVKNDYNYPRSDKGNTADDLAKNLNELFFGSGS